jgi:ATP-dependent Clp endopeptidase proteolytic subunit ClpP
MGEFMFNRVTKKNFNPETVLDSYYNLFGEVNAEEAKAFSQWIISNNMLPKSEAPECLTFIINSEGGCLFSAWAIIDMMDASEIPVRVIGMGQVGSSALLILMSGRKGLRSISENVSILSHQFSSGAEGKFHELSAIYHEFNNTNERLIDHMKKCTGLVKKQIKKKLMSPTDVFLTAEQAINLGLADTITRLKYNG